MTDLNAQVQIGSGDDVETIALADLAGLDISSVEANYGFTPTPAGHYHFRVKNAELAPQDIADRSDGAAPDAKITVPTVAFDLEAVNVINLSDKSLAPEQYIGWEHQEKFFIKDAVKDIGRCRALMENAGMQWAGKFSDLLDAFVGHEFTAIVTNRKDKNDTDRIYANIDLKKVKPVGGGQQMAAVAAGAVPPTSPPAGAAPTKPAFSLGGNK